MRALSIKLLNLSKFHQDLTSGTCITNGWSTFPPPLNIWGCSKRPIVDRVNQQLMSCLQFKINELLIIPKSLSCAVLLENVKKQWFLRKRQEAPKSFKDEGSPLFLWSKILGHKMSGFLDMKRRINKRSDMPYRAKLFRAKFWLGETICRAKFSSPNEKFVTFARRKVSPNK